MYMKHQTHENSNWLHNIVKHIKVKTNRNQLLHTQTNPTPKPTSKTTTKQPMRNHMIKQMQVGPSVLHQLPINAHHTSENKKRAVHKMLTTRLKVPVGPPRKRLSTGGPKVCESFNIVRQRGQGPVGHVKRPFVKHN